MTAERILGFILLTVGVGVVFYSLYASYGIFTGTSDPPEFYSVPIEPPVAREVAPTPSQPASLEDVQGQLQDIIGQQLGNILPADAIPKTLNLFIWSIFTGILIFGGSQIAGIGVKLLQVKKG